MEWISLHAFFKDFSILLILHFVIKIRQIEQIKAKAPSKNIYKKHQGSLVIYTCDYLCETSLKTNVATDKGKDRNEM